MIFALSRGYIVRMVEYMTRFVFLDEPGRRSACEGFEWRVSDGDMLTG